MQNIYNFISKCNNKNDKIFKLSKNIVDNLGRVSYNKNTLKNGHLQNKVRPYLRKEEIPLDTIEEQFYRGGYSDLGSCFHTECLY